MKKQLDYNLLSNAFLLTYKTAMETNGYTIEHHTKDSPFHKLYNEFNIDGEKDTGILPILAFQDSKNSKKILYLSDDYIDEIKSYEVEAIIYKYEKIFREGYKFLYFVEEEKISSPYITSFGFCSKGRLKNDITNQNHYDESINITYIGIYPWRQPFIMIHSPIIKSIREYFHQKKGKEYFNNFSDE